MPSPEVRLLRGAGTAKLETPPSWYHKSRGSVAHRQPSPQPVAVVRWLNPENLSLRSGDQLKRLLIVELPVRILTVAVIRESQAQFILVPRSRTAKQKWHHKIQR
ncbi:hypothetical protein CEXT_601671 [Caerostris extrusa]|uniref:Uncharacterized protein n=1 Tax=Caerostris extrusa TaxID=172846 RepID=A0AAV4MR83_CAEEX|nr:hypothetical protein CEXT_601671 [Caerostris extrusa]